MARNKQAETVIRWSDILSSARPVLLVAIELLLQTKQLAPYSKALRLLSLAIDRLIPKGDDRLVVAAVRKTQKQLGTLNKVKPAKRRAVLTKLKNQITEL